MVLRFVIGRSAVPKEEEALRVEAAIYGGFLRLQITESYALLSYKSHEFFKEVVKAYDPAFVLKMDDDLYLQVQRVPAVVRQWQDNQKDYVGCHFVGSPVFQDRSHKWFEPYGNLFPRRYHTYAQGTLYALSRHALDLLMKLPDDSKLRYFKSEDVTVGLWMLVLNVNHFDDARLCAQSCNDWSVAVRDLNCAGLCELESDMWKLHGERTCHAEGPSNHSDLPAAPWNSNPWLKEFNHQPRPRDAARVAVREGEAEGSGVARAALGSDGVDGRDAEWRPGDGYNLLRRRRRKRMYVRKHATT